MLLRYLLVASLTLGCASEEEDGPAMTAEQASATFTGTWSGTYARAGQPDGTLTFTLRMANPVPTVKCGSHVLSTKCSGTTTSVGLLGTVTTSDGAFAATEVRAGVVLGSPSAGWFEASATGATVAYGNYRDGAIHDGTLKLPTGEAKFKVLTRK